MLISVYGTGDKRGGLSIKKTNIGVAIILISSEIVSIRIHFPGSGSLTAGGPE
jgi:hypothetical protein